MYKCRPHLEKQFTDRQKEHKFKTEVHYSWFAGPTHSSNFDSVILKTKIEDTPIYSVFATPRYGANKLVGFLIYDLANSNHNGCTPERFLIGPTTHAR